MSMKQKLEIIGKLTATPSLTPERCAALIEDVLYGIPTTVDDI